MTQNAEMELKKQIQRQIRAVSSVGSHNNKLTTAEVTVGANLLKPNIPSPLASSSKTRTTADTVAKKISGAESFDDNLHAKPRKVQFDVIEDKSKGTLKQPNNGDVLMESFSAELFQRAGNALKVSLKDAGGHRSSFDEPQHQEIPVRSEPSHSARTRSEDKSAQLCKCKSCTLRREGAIQDVPKVVPAESIERRISRKTATSAAANQTGKSAGQKSPVKSAKPRETAKVGVKVNKIKLHPSAYSKVPIESRNRPPVPDLLVDITTKTEMVNSSPKLAQKKLESNSPVVGRNSRPYVPTVAEKPKSMSPAAIRNVKPTTSGMPSRKSQDSVEENVNWSFVALNFVENGRNRPAENSHETVEFPAMGEAEGTKDETCCNSFLFLEMPSEASDPNKQKSQYPQREVRPSTNQPGTVQWKKGPLLGRGAFGTVWCGLTATGELIAVKQAEITDVDMDKAEKEYKKIQEEVALLKCLNHTNIVGYLGTCLVGNTVSIFMQYVPGGSIAGILKKFGPLNEEIVSKYTKQLLEGVQYIHAKDVIHRDIKGSNIMVMPNAVIKLIDFGCAKRILNLTKSNTEVLKSMKGTPFWMAPEVLNETGHGKKSDIWSVGCTVYEMVTATPPFSHMPKWTAIYAIASGSEPVQLPPTSSDIGKDFVSCCLQRDINLRPSADELLSHNFISFYSQTSRRIQDSRGNPLNCTVTRKS